MYVNKKETEAIHASIDFISNALVSIPFHLCESEEEKTTCEKSVENIEDILSGLQSIVRKIKKQ